MNGFPTATLTDQNGAYSAEVEYGWSGTVMPVLAGYKFEPRSIQYPKVVSPMSEQNYKPTLITYTISGSVMLPEVKMVGFPDEVVSDATGRYIAIVPMNWNGKVTPEKTAFQFDPPTRPYNKVARDMKDENYKGSEQIIVISGSAGVQGAVLKGLPGNPVAGPQGVYRAEVKYGCQRESHTHAGRACVHPAGDGIPGFDGESGEPELHGQRVQLPDFGHGGHGERGHEWSSGQPSDRRQWLLHGHRRARMVRQGDARESRGTPSRRRRSRSRR